MTPQRAKGKQGAGGHNGNADLGTPCGAPAHDVVMRPIETVACPHCGREFPFTAALRAQLAGAMDDAVQARIAQAASEAAQRAQENARLDVEAAQREVGEARAAAVQARDRELALLRRERAVEDREHAAELEMARQLAEERELLRLAAEERAREQLARDTAELRDRLEAMGRRLQAAEEAETALRLQRIDIEERETRLALEVQRQIDAQRPLLVQQATQSVEYRHAVELEQREIEIRRLSGQIEALRSSASAAQELRGESQEVVLRDLLVRACPHDLITDVPRGKRGGDLRQEVRNAAGQCAGLVLWESKNVRSWSEAWAEKLKRDQRECDADAAVLVSPSLPRGVEHVGLYSGVFVTSLGAAEGVAHLVRHLVLRLSAARSDSATRDAQLRELHEVLSSNSFRLRLQAIFDALATMSRDLETERAAMHRWHARREAQIAQFSKAAAEVVGQIEAATGTRQLDGHASSATAEEDNEHQGGQPSSLPDHGRNDA
jgi:hypothetical protein